MEYWYVSKVYEEEKGMWYFNAPTKSGEVVPYGPWSTEELAERSARSIRESVVKAHNDKAYKVNSGTV